MTKLTMIATVVWLVLAVFFAGALSIQVPCKFAAAGDR
jgi:hypothetical protein